MSGPAIVLVVLAAGTSERFGSDKLLAPVGGRPLLATTLAIAAEVVDPASTTVAIGPGQRRREVVAKVAGTEVVIAADAARGMRWTLHAALGSLSHDAPGALVALADDPLALDALGAVHARALGQPDRIFAVRRTPFLPHPVYLPRHTWPPPPAADDDAGLRELLTGDDVSWVEVAGPRPTDVDEPTDVKELRAALRQRVVDLRADQHDQR